MDSSTDAGDATADAGCGSAMLDGPCTVNGAFCGGPCGDVCGFCNLLECRDGTWGGVEVGPAPCFDCGSERCQADVQYCSRTISGVPGGDDSFACADPPEDCRSMVTCACLMTAGVAGDCDEPNPGEVTVSIAAP